MNKIYRKISAALLAVCLGGMSVMAVSDAICEHENVYISEYIVSIESEEFGHTIEYDVKEICEACGENVRSYPRTYSESHDYKVILSSSYEDYDYPYYRTVYIDVQECTVCGYTITNEYEIIH